MHIDDFDYHLPEELIAQYPNEKRDYSKMLVFNRSTMEVEHRHFCDILEYLRAGDCLVLNNSKVLPARLFCEKELTGAKIEILLIKRIEGDVWKVMAKPAKKLKPGDMLTFENGKLKAQVVAYTNEGTRKLKFIYDNDKTFMEIIGEIGKIPLPPYINRESDNTDKERYQTVFCKTDGSVAAPTAGLHFTQEILAQAKEKGVHIAYVTLHVGIGTFKPVQCDIVEEHKMHFEEYEISEIDSAIINKAKEEGRRVICIGTTSTRTVESAAILNENSSGNSANYIVKSGSGKTDIFIYPGYEFKIMDSLLTNFHLPKSTLLMLISAMHNREYFLNLYKIAIEKKYKFFSYGDCMLII